MRRMRQIAVEIIFNERHPALGQNPDQLRLLLVGHATAERVAVVKGKNAGPDAAAIQPFDQFIQADAFAGMCGNLAGLHAKGLDDLQDAVVGRRLDGDRIARSRHRPQTQVEAFSIRVVSRTLPGKQFVVGRELRARIATALREEGITLPAELEAGATRPS